MSCPISEWKRLEGEHLNELARKRKLTNFWIKSEFKIFKNDTQTGKNRKRNKLRRSMESIFHLS